MSDAEPDDFGSPVIAVVGDRRIDPIRHRELLSRIVSPILHAGPQTATTLNTGVPQSGEYHLVVSNRFSVITRKNVQGQVTVTCHGLQARQL